MIRLKTSVLIGLSLEMGAILAQTSREISDALYRIGELIGLGFQLKDDLLDVYGDPEKFGKQAGGDILSNKKTFLLIRALEQAKGQVQTDLQGWLAAENFDPQEKVQAVTAIYNALGIKKETEEEINQYFDQAFLAMEQLPLEAGKKEGLLKFMRGLVDREV
jgi:geranylgeranyl diphosphate synthase type II